MDKIVTLGGILVLIGLGLFLFFSGSASQSEWDGSNRVVMLGDSITMRVNWNRLLERSDMWNQGVDGDTTTDILARLPSILKVRPRLCFFMAGINDISRGAAMETVKSNMGHILGALASRDIPTVILSTLYVSETAVESRQINRQVAGLNRWLRHAARKGGHRFLNLNETLSGSGGLKEIYTVDGVHLSAAGYRAWADVIAPLLSRESESRPPDGN